MTECGICAQKGLLVSEALGVCAQCIKREPQRTERFWREAHLRARREFDLPYPIPQGEVRCDICGNRCGIGEGGLGFCGLRRNEGGRIRSLLGADRGLASWYYDPIPTNCVAAWSCGMEEKGRGKNNLAVFPGACSFDCLFCQNWQYREMTRAFAPVQTLEELAAGADARTCCVCFFGGDPAPQMPFLLEAAEKMLERAGGRGLRICWETNGSVGERFLLRMAEMSLASGGCVKFDLKAWNENLHLALTGVRNRQTLSNFETLAHFAEVRQTGRVGGSKGAPLLTAATLLVPGYVDEEEVGHIASFIAGLSRVIPYSLLAFHPSFAMRDLPTTSRAQALRCLEAARGAGVENVRVGNVHLLT